MKLKKISTNKLFGVFDHNIELKERDGITIIIGENGLGKTVILEATHCLFNSRYSYFGDIEFDDFSFYFDNGEIWKIVKRGAAKDRSLYVARTFEDKPNLKLRYYRIYYGHPIHSPWEVNVSGLTWNDFSKEIEDCESEDNLDYKNEFIKRKMYYKHASRFTDEKTKPPKWYTDGIENINIEIIETQRILSRTGENKAFIDTVGKCSKELKDYIEHVKRKASYETTRLDSTYPNRLIKKHTQGKNDSIDELNTALSTLAERRKELSALGLVVDSVESTDSVDSDILQINESQQHLISILKLYIDDSHRKLDPFDEIAKKINLFIEIINKRFKHKDIVINKDGFTFESTVNIDNEGNFKEIRPSKLSSGEQHELVLFFKLIFNTKPGDMILIDEPELSLHISWQNEFIGDLKEVTTINDVSVIIATHSPDIIDENWNLTVELNGVE